MSPLLKFAAATALTLLLGQMALQAQPRIPEGKTGSLSRESTEFKRSARVFNADLDLGSFSVDTENRAEVRAFFKAIYFASERVDMGWTGDYAETSDLVAAKGDTSDAYKEAVLLRINYFRAMVGIPADITLDADFNAQAQAAALIMSGSDQLSHTPIAHNFPNYVTSLGDAAASASNIAIGSAGPDSVDGYIQDKGSGNAAAGHRRWLFYPPSLQMGTGDVPGGSAPQAIYDAVNTRFGYTPSELRRANAIHVLSNDNFGPYPQTAYPYVAYPQSGYIPYQLVYPRWSFAIPGADFSNASVTMTRDGAPVSVQLEPYDGNSFGDNTLVWVYDGLDASVTQSHARPNQDTLYEVTVSGITGAANASYTYQVTVIDPDVPGQTEIQTLLTGNSSPLANAPNQYNINDPEFNSGFQWRVFQKTDFSGSEGAESGMGALQASLSSGLTGLYTGPDVASGSSAFHFVQTEGGVTQSITFPQTFVGSSQSQLSFASQLQWSTATQFAKVQVSLDQGVSWQDVFSQAGTGGSGEPNYDVKTVDLDFDNKTFLVRFAYTHEGSTFFPQDSPAVGWLLDDISFSNVEIVTNETLSSHQESSTVFFTPAEEETYCLQARGVLFQEYPMEWGPIKEVTALVTNLQPGAGDDEATIETETETVEDNVLTNDDDPNGDALTVTHVQSDQSNVGKNVILTYGSINMKSDGSFSYKRDNSNEMVASLTAGKSLQESVAYQISDGKGGTDTATLTITLTNSTPILVVKLLDFQRDAQGATLSWESITGHEYELQRSADLKTWISDSRPITLEADIRSARFTPADLDTGAFYRVKATTPDAN